jgi:hypothetical protein
MFNSREDIYTTKTFPTTEEAATFVSVIAQSFKQQGYKITEMSIREYHSYDVKSDVYIGTVAAFKEQEAKVKEDAKPEEVNEAPKETVN